MHIPSNTDYVIRTIALGAIGANMPVDAAPPSTRYERRAAQLFDSAMAAAEVLLGPPGSDGRHPVLAGGEAIARARSTGRSVVVAAVSAATTAPRVAGRWQVHHAA